MARARSAAERKQRSDSPSIAPAYYAPGAPRSFLRGDRGRAPRLRGVDYLEPGTAIHVEDLEAWEREAGVRVESGDVLFVRTGRWARRAEHGPWEMNRDAAGLHASVAPWLRERGVAMLGADGTNDVLPSGVEGVTQPIHQLTIIAMGMPLFDNLDLEAVAAEAARRHRWEFLLVAAPLAVDGGTGSPLNPLAIF